MLVVMFVHRSNQKKFDSVSLIGEAKH
jgi:hypothetical protein